MLPRAVWTALGLAQGQFLQVGMGQGCGSVACLRSAGLLDDAVSVYGPHTPTPTFKQPTQTGSSSVKDVPPRPVLSPHVIGDHTTRPTQCQLPTNSLDLSAACQESFKLPCVIGQSVCFLRTRSDYAFVWEITVSMPLRIATRFSTGVVGIDLPVVSFLARSLLQAPTEQAPGQPSVGDSTAPADPAQPLAGQSATGPRLSPGIGKVTGPDATGAKLQPDPDSRNESSATPGPSLDDGRVQVFNSTIIAINQFPPAPPPMPPGGVLRRPPPPAKKGASGLCFQPCRLLCHCDMTDPLCTSCCRCQ